MQRSPRSDYLLLAHVRDGDPAQKLPQLLDQRQTVLKVGVELLSVLLQIGMYFFENLSAIEERGASFKYIQT